MGKTGKQGKERLDKYYKLAKDQGYRSRAAFKLIQLNKKYDLLGKSKAVVDLCAAPGGWLQVAGKYMPPQSFLIGVDLVPIRSIPHAITLTEDITTAKCRSAIKKEVKGTPIDLVLHDGAPNMGTAWLQDAFTQSELTLHALRLAVDVLRPGGSFVTKVFRSKDYNALMFVMKQLFTKVEATKPAASRNVSSEIFVVCQNFLAPKKIDPRVLDPKYVFKDIEGDVGEGPLVNIFHKKFGKKRNRDGYEHESESILYTHCTVQQFVESPNPMALLAEKHEIKCITPDDAVYLGSPLTSREVKACLKDLKVLSKGDFKDLLKWRLKMREKVMPNIPRVSDQPGAESGEEDAGAEEEGEEGAQGEKGEGDTGVVPVNSEDELDRELENFKKRQEADKKRHKRRDNKAKARARMRIALKMNARMPAYEDEDTSLFSLAALRSKDSLANFVGASKRALVPMTSEEAADREVQDVEEEDESGESDLDAQQAYDRHLERQLDTMWQQFTNSRSLLASSRRGRANKRNKRGEGEEGEEGDVTRVGDEGEAGESGEEEEGAGLIVGQPSVSQKAALWFSQEQFAGLEEEEEDDTAEVLAMANKFREQQEKKRKRAQSAADKSKSMENGTTGSDAGADSKTDTGSSMDGGDADTQLVDGEENGADGGEGEGEGDGEGWGLEEGEVFNERVDALLSSDEESEDEFAGNSGGGKKKRRSEIIHDKAETLALAKKLLNPATREEVVDAAYNRYAFNDPELPDWFAVDEKAHSRPNLPITKEEVNEMKTQFDALNGRTIKKVAEAKARKKKRLVRAMGRMKDQAEGILKNTEISDKSKMKEIEKLYKSKHTKQQVSKVYVVNRGAGKQTQSGGPSGKNAGGSKTHVRTKLVDKRLKSDKRGQLKAKGRKKR